jgi:hypothetical protein
MVAQRSIDHGRITADAPESNRHRASQRAATTPSAMAIP